MKNRAACIFLILLIPLSLSAEMVLLFTVDKNGDKDLIKSTHIVSSAIEEGIMDRFFEAGHIIFNAGINDDHPAELPIDADRLSLRLAKNSGASFLIELDLIYPEGTREKNTIPEIITYRFYTVVSEENLVSGSIITGSVRESIETISTDFCFKMGKIIAIELLQLL